MGVEEFRLLLPAVGTLTIPPERALAIKDGAGGAGHGYVSTGDGDKGA